MAGFAPDDDSPDGPQRADDILRMVVSDESQTANIYKIEKSETQRYGTTDVEPKRDERLSRTIAEGIIKLAKEAGR